MTPRLLPAAATAVGVATIAACVAAAWSVGQPEALVPVPLPVAWWAAGLLAPGGSVIDPVVVEGLLSRRSRQEQSPVSRLTDRERQVLEAMASGLSNTAIAARLHLSVSAVEKNVNAIFTKLELSQEPSVHRRVGAVLTYLAHPS